MKLTLTTISGHFKKEIECEPREAIKHIKEFAEDCNIDKVSITAQLEATLETRVKGLGALF